MSLNVWNGTAWQTASAIKVWDGTAWTSAISGKIWNGTSWVDFFTPYSVAISNISALNNSQAGTGNQATATYRLTNTGIARRTDSNGVLQNITGEWLVSGTASLFEVQGTWGTGTGTTGGPTGWVSLGTTRDWTLTAPGGGGGDVYTYDLTVEIRLIGSSTVLDTAVISFYVDNAI